MPLASTLHDAPSVQEGISALVETCGLKPAELQQLRLRSERLFEALGESLTAVAGKPAKLAYLKMETQSGADFCAQAKRHHFTALGFGDLPAIFLKIDLVLACAVVRSAIGGDVSDLAGDASSISLTPLESRVLAHAIPEIFSAATQRAFGDLFANRQALHVLASSADPSAVKDDFKGSEQLTSASVECAIAGVSATISFAIPLPIVVEARERLAPARLERRMPEGETEKVRKALAAAPLELSAVLGSVATSLGEIRSLEPGSIVLLQKLEHQKGLVPSLTLRCAGRTLFVGTVVEDGGWYRFLVQPIPVGGDLSGDRSGNGQAG